MLHVLIQGLLCDSLAYAFQQHTTHKKVGMNKPVHTHASIEIRIYIYVDAMHISVLGHCILSS